MEPLEATRIFTAGRGRSVGCAGELLRVVESTMDTARQRAARGVPDGYVVLAERQRAGRGRRGPWECPARQGLLMSVVLRLGLPRSERRLFTLLGAVAAAEAAQAFGVQARIKWPNDVVVAERAGRLVVRKLGGVLVELYQPRDEPAVHILGIGLNVNQTRRELPADTPIPCTSMRAELGGECVDRTSLCRRLLERLDFWYGKLRMGHPEALLARWRTLSCLLGERVRAEVCGSIVEGRVLGLRATGELILQPAAGPQLLLSGERAVLLLGRRTGRDGTAGDGAGS